MVTYSFNFNGRTYTNDNFEGTNYAGTWGQFYADVLAHLANLPTATSSSSVAVGTGSKAFVVEPNKWLGVGWPLRIARTSDPTVTYMDGIVTAYNSSTGALVVSVGTSVGSGTFNDWTMGIGGGRVAATLPLSIGEGGSGATTSDQALTNLGASSLGKTLLGSVSAAAARASLGSTTVGDALFTSSTAAVARSSLGAGATGDALFTAASPTAARSALGSSVTGDALFIAATTAAARAAIGSGAAGDAVFTAATAPAARATLGSTSTGDALFVASSPAVALNALGVSAVAQTLIGQTTAAAMRSYLGLGSLATQDASNVNITGGSISGVFIPVPFSIPTGNVLLIDLSAAPSNSGIITIASPVPNAACGQVAFRCPVGSTSYKLSGPSTFSVMTGILSGSSGASGSVTVSPHSDNKIYIENRLGYTFTGTYYIQFSA